MAQLEVGGVRGAANWAEVVQTVRAAAADWDLARALLMSFDLQIEPVTESDAETAAAMWHRGWAFARRPTLPQPRRAAQCNRVDRGCPVAHPTGGRAHSVAAPRTARMVRSLTPSSRESSIGVETTGESSVMEQPFTTSPPRGKGVRSSPEAGGQRCRAG